MSLLPHSAKILMLVIGITFSCATPDASAETAGHPYQLAPLRETAITLMGASLALSGHLASSEVTPPGTRPLHRSDIPGFDRIALDLHSETAGNVSDITRGVCVVLPILANANIFRPHERASYENALTIVALYAESSLLVGGITSLAKGTVHRIRPYAYDPDAATAVLNERGAATSFWSGHAAIAFNSAVFTGVVFQAYHPDSRFVTPVWALGLATATASGVLRVRAGDHFPTDVIAGAAAGSLTGWLVPHLHRTGTGESHSITITPTVNGVPGIGVRRAF